MTATPESLTPRSVPPVEDTDPEAARLGALVRARLFDAGEGAPRIGRFTLLSSIGQGGMGVVYSAYDPDLDRRVALKLLRGGDGGRGRERMVREARTMAKLNHPNVAAVYEAAVHGDEIVIAMEFVNGKTLRAWRATPRTPGEILDVYAQAGRGLIAAHEAGIVHRDFKPDNVLVGEDGRVRVLDFGLAHRHASTVELAVDGSEPATALTRSGSLGGTPAYMAPEQWRGEPLDARADQFAFCVALYEALWGTRPFAGQTTVSLMHDVLAGAVQPPPREPAVSARVRTAILRGLSTDVDARWRDMDALLDALAPVGGRRRVRVAVAALVVAGAAAGFFGGRSGGDGQPEPCVGLDAGLRGIWDAERSEQLHAVLSSSATPYAAATVVAVARELDGWRQRWIAAADDACAAARVRGDQTEDELELRMSCLRGRARDVGALVDVLVAGEPGTLEHAADAAAGAPDVEACANLELLREQPTPPTDPERVAKLRDELARVAALEATGQYRAAEASADAAVAEANAIGWPPAIAEALARSGSAQLAQGQPVRARDALRSAYYLAVEHGSMAVEVEAAAALVFIEGEKLGRPEAALAWTDQALALARRAHDRDAESTVLANSAYAYHAKHEYAQAVARAREALELRRELSGDGSVLVAQSRHSLGEILRRVARLDEALAELERAREIITSELGPDHPKLGFTLNAIATTHAFRGDYELALRVRNEALDLRRRSLGEQHLDVGATLIDLSFVLRQLGRMAEAEQAARQGAEIVERSGVADDQVGKALDNLAAALQELGRSDEAAATYERAIRAMEAALGPDDPALAFPLSGLGWVRYGSGDTAGANALWQRAVAIREAALEPDAPELADAYDNLGVGLVAAGEPLLAEPHHRRALAIRRGRLGERHDLVASGRHNLGEALLAQKRLDEAAQEFALARDILVERMGAESPFVAYPLVGLGQVAVARGRFADAVELFTRALQLRTAALGSHHPLIAPPLGGLGVALLGLGRRAEAFDAVEALSAIDAPCEPEVAETLIASVPRQDSVGRKRTLAVAAALVSRCAKCNPLLIRRLESLGR